METDEKLKKILFISAWFPYPLDNGSKIRIINILKGLSELHQVTLFTFAQQDDYQKYLPLLNQYCKKIYVAQKKEFNPRRGLALLGFLNQKPRSWIDTYSKEMEVLIHRELESDPDYDLVIYSEIDSINYHHLLHGIPGILEDLELGTYQDALINAVGTRERIRRGMTWWKIRRYISNHIYDFQACTVVSEKEKGILNSIVPGYDRVEIIPNGIVVSEYRAEPCQPEPEQIIFTGSLKYPVNYEAINFFIGEIFPIIEHDIPEVRLIITGNQERVDFLPGRNNPRITYTGFVKDVRQLIAGSQISIAPLKSGGGTRLKILESMALGTPVVATSKGVEGLKVENKKHVLIADKPAEFASS